MSSLIFLGHLCSFLDILLVVIKSSSMRENMREEIFMVPMQKGVLRERKDTVKSEKGVGREFKVSRERDGSQFAQGNKFSMR